MKTVLVTVADDRSGKKGGVYTEVQGRLFNLFKENPQFGIEDFQFWNWLDIAQTKFYWGNKAMLDQPDADMNGRCYKPFAISEGLASISEGDFLIYNDVSPEIWNDHLFISPSHKLERLQSLCIDNGGILTTTASHNHSIYDHTHEYLTLDRCMSKMGLSQYKYSLQHASGMIVIQKSKRSVEFVEEWLHWNLEPECASLGPVGGPQTYWLAECVEKVGHRHDQSISGLLLNKLDNSLLIHDRWSFLDHCLDRPHMFVKSNRPPAAHKLVKVRTGEHSWKMDKVAR